MKRDDLRKFLSSSTFAAGFVLSAVYFFEVELSEIARFFFASGLLVVSMITLALMIVFVMNKFRKDRKKLLDLKPDELEKP